MKEHTKKVYRTLAKTIGNALTLMGLVILEFTYVPIIYNYLDYKNNQKKQEMKVEEKTEEQIEESMNIDPIIPVDENFTIIIPKIDLNVPVVENVSMINEKEYMEALRNGVAHAKGTAVPGEPGNTFIFAHSSLNFWQLGKYATVFNLIKELEKGDTISLHYKGDTYIYSVIDKTVVPGWNTSPFDQEYDEPIVTLITCDPPGTTINRMVVRAKLINM